MVLRPTKPTPDEPSGPLDPEPAEAVEMPENSPDSAQPTEGGGVSRGMATVAVDAGGFQSLRRENVFSSGTVDWGQLLRRRDYVTRPGGRRRRIWRSDRKIP